MYLEKLQFPTHTRNADKLNSKVLITLIYCNRSKFNDKEGVWTAQKVA